MPGKPTLPSSVTLMSCADVILRIEERDTQRGEGGAPNKRVAVQRGSHWALALGWVVLVRGEEVGLFWVEYCPEVGVTL